MFVCKDLLTLVLDKPTVTPQFGVTLICHKSITKRTPLALPFGKKVVSNSALSSPTLLSPRRSWVVPRNWVGHELSVCALRVNCCLSSAILPWLTPLRVLSKSDISSGICCSISLDEFPAQVPLTYLPICSHYPYPAPLCSSHPLFSSQLLHPSSLIFHLGTHSQLVLCLRFHLPTL